MEHMGKDGLNKDGVLRSVQGCGRNMGQLSATPPVLCLLGMTAMRQFKNLFTKGRYTQLKIP